MVFDMVWRGKDGCKHCYGLWFSLAFCCAFHSVQYCSLFPDTCSFRKKVKGLCQSHWAHIYRSLWLTKWIFSCLVRKGELYWAHTQQWCCICLGDWHCYTLLLTHWEVQKRTHWTEWIKHAILVESGRKRINGLFWGLLIHRRSARDLLGNMLLCWIR